MGVLPSQLSSTGAIGVLSVKRVLIMMMLNTTHVKGESVNHVAERNVLTTTAPITRPFFAIFATVTFMAIIVLIITAKRIFVKHKKPVKSVMPNSQ